MTTRPMTRTEALAEARKRWGKRGAAWCMEARPSGLRAVCIVGERGAYSDIRRGSGPTWEDAFADAERRERGQS